MIVQDEPIGIDLRELQPLRDWLVVKRIWKIDQWVPEYSGIAIPDTAQKKPHYGKVLRVGPGRRFPDGTRKPMQVKVGDYVCYQSAEVDTKDLVLIQEGDILGIECPTK